MGTIWNIRRRKKVYMVSQQVFYRKIILTQANRYEVEVEQKSHWGGGGAREFAREMKFCIEEGAKEDRCTLNKDGNYFCKRALVFLKISVNKRFSLSPRILKWKMKRKSMEKGSCGLNINFRDFLNRFLSRGAITSPHFKRIRSAKWNKFRELEIEN